jgi:hypothetical protein
LPDSVGLPLLPSSDGLFFAGLNDNLPLAGAKNNAAAVKTTSNKDQSVNNWKR